jgi:hypothetical protein
MPETHDLIEHVCDLSACSPPAHRGAINRRVDGAVAYGIESRTG